MPITAGSRGERQGLQGLPHFPPKAKRVIYLHQSGGPSQLDLFDYKPELKKHQGTELPASVRMGQRMARVALPYAKKGEPARSEIRLKSVTRMQSPKPRILVQFSGVSGRLRAPGRPTGFVFKRPSGETVDWAFKAELDPHWPDSVILWTTTLPAADVALYYGAGPAPYVNIVDDDDMPLPAFGPIAVE